MPTLSHLDASGRASMVDVTTKPITDRRAIARGDIAMRPETLTLIREGNLKKGDVLSTAQLAGVMAAKRTSDLIPLCHPLALNSIQVRLELDEEHSCIHVEAEVASTGKTGVEMEALTAVTVAALTVYDMAKAVDRHMRIEAIRLIEKRGGQSGDIVLE